MDSALLDRTSHQFLDQWKRLVSTTNWEKGQIICNWREALRSSGAPVSEYSDEAWSRRVGNVTAQHVGRLRRAFERFGESRDEYRGLYWSHFQAALDWDDAQMWLEGAVQSDWSISEMRRQRWEVRGGQEPLEDEGDLASSWDEDAEPQDASDEVVSGTLGVVNAPQGNSHREDEVEETHDDSQFDDEGEQAVVSRATPARGEAVRPFADLPPLPSDVNDAFEAYKLSILRHKLAGWREISREDLLASLDALKMLACAPADF